MIFLVALLVIVLVYALTRQPAPTSSALYPHVPSAPRISYLSLLTAIIKWKLLGQSFLQQLNSSFGSVVVFKVPFFRDIALFTDRKYAKTFFAHKESDFFHGTKFAFAVMPNDLKNMQESITPIIARSFSAERYTYIANVVQKEVQQFLEEKSGKKIDLFEEMRRFQTTIMTRIFLGTEIQGKELDRFLFLLGDLDLEDRISHRFVEVMLPSGKKKTEEHWEEFKAMVKKVVDNRIATKSTLPDYLNDVIDKHKKNGVPDYTFITICVFSAIFAASTNTYAASAWSILFVESNPDVKRKVIAEMQEYLKVISEGQDPTPLLLSTKFTNRVLTETIRLTTKGLSPRLALEDISLDDSCFVPKDTLMVFLFDNVVASDEIFSNVSTYNPNRYETEATNPFEDITLGAGRHPCTGAKLVNMDVKILLFSLLGQYQCVLNGDVHSFLPKSQPIGVFRPAKPCFVQINKREM